MNANDYSASADVPLDLDAGVFRFPRARSLRECLVMIGAAASLVFSGLSAAQITSMPSRDAPIDAPAAERYRTSVAAFDGVPSFGDFVIAAPLAAELAAAKLVGGTHKVALGRTPAFAAAHADVPAGTTQARLTVTSADAQMIRAALVFSDASDYEIAAWSPDSESAALMTSSNRAFGQMVWTPVTSGEKQVLAVTRRSNDGKAWSVDVPRVSHFYANVLSANTVQPERYGAGTSASCQADMACVLALTTPDRQPALQAASNAVALLLLTYADGTSGACTGTLLNSASYPATIIITAGHCVAGDAGTQVLTSLTTVWFFARPTCGSTAVGNYVQIVNTGRTLWQSTALDGALLYAYEAPPYPAAYAAWNANPVSGGNSTILAIHHPRADVKKGSFANLAGINTTPVTIGPINYPAGAFYLLDWEVGVVEPGSSGSGMFMDDPAGRLFMSLRATLTGGSATCSNTGARTYYSILANMFPYMGGFLTLPVSPPSTFDMNQHGLTGSWYEAATGGQGLEVEMFPNLSSASGSAFVSWFTYDTVIGGAERQRWYTAQGPVTTGKPSVPLTLYQNTGGNFNLPPATTAQAVGTATLTFTTCSAGQMSYTFTDGSGRTGTIPLTRLTQNVTCSTTTPHPTNADFALSGNWYGGPATSGQGFTVEVNPNSGRFFSAWYTYMPNGSAAAADGQRWYTAEGAFAAGLRSIPVTIYETTGGLFDSPTPPGQATFVVGTGTMAFQSCSAATFSYAFSSGSNSGQAGTINLSRVGPVPPGCTS